MKVILTLACVCVAAAFLSTIALAQLCAAPCNGTQIVCQHQNGIRNHRGGPATALAGPNGATGNVLGDAEWKIWGVENGMTRGSGAATFTNWEIGASSPGPGTQSFDIPDLELRPVVLVGGVKEPDMTAVPLDTELVGNIALPTGGFRINVTILGPTVAAPASCVGNAGLSVLSNADVAMLFLYTPGEVTTQTDYYLNFRLNTEVNTVSNPSVPTTGVGNSYSGTVDALLGVVTHYAINEELYGEMGLYEPTLESYRLTTGFAAPTRGSGARELAAGDLFFLVSEDWEAGNAAINGEDRLAAVMISDSTAGSPLGLAPPGNPPFFLAGSLFLPGSTGVLGLYPTATTVAFLNFSATLGAGLNCHVVVGGACTAAGIPSVFTDLQAMTAVIAVPPGLTGAVLYAAAFYVNLSTFTLDDGSNTVELLFL
ncbi:MAG TPA: hypothetical protein VFI25_03560 [Planctomycetota bacterium]|jgi:hypothetical protein|nr:hypothetical protein [Planctomycetota bacterium]